MKQKLKSEEKKDFLNYNSQLGHNEIYSEALGEKGDFVNGRNWDDPPVKYIEKYIENIENLFEKLMENNFGRH